MVLFSFVINTLLFLKHKYLILQRVVCGAVCAYLEYTIKNWFLCLFDHSLGRTWPRFLVLLCVHRHCTQVVKLLHFSLFQPVL